MKRRTYQIKQDGLVIATKYSWNSACREIRNLVRARMKPGEQAVLFSYDFHRDEENKEFVKGSEIWHINDGRVLCLTFQIEQVL